MFYAKLFFAVGSTLFIFSLPFLLVFPFSKSILYSAVWILGCAFLVLGTRYLARWVVRAGQRVDRVLDRFVEMLSSMV